MLYYKRERKLLRVALLSIVVINHNHDSNVQKKKNRYNCTKMLLNLYAKRKSKIILYIAIAIDIGYKLLRYQIINNPNLNKHFHKFEIYVLVFYIIIISDVKVLNCFVMTNQ